MESIENVNDALGKFEEIIKRIIEERKTTRRKGSHDKDTKKKNGGKSKDSDQTISRQEVQEPFNSNANTKWERGLANLPKNIPGS